MSTKNPKVSGYVPQVLKDRLAQFQEEQGGISESQAIIIVLSEYFGVEQEVKKSAEGVVVGGVTLARLEALEERLAKVEQLVDLSSSSPVTTIEVSSLSVGHSQEKLNLSLELPQEFPPISGYKLSKLRFGLGKNAVGSAKKYKSTEEFTEWTKQNDPDRISWKPVKAPSKGYVPLSKLSSELQVKLNKWIEENI